MKEAVWVKIFEIEKELSKYNEQDPSLYAGSIGIAIFYEQLYTLTKDKNYAKKVTQLIDHTITQLSEVQMPHTLCSGFTGVAWGLNYLAKKGFLEDDPDDLFEDLDNYIYDAGISDLSKGQYDFLHGGTGSIIYAINRLSSDKARIFLNQAIAEVDKTKIEDEFGFKWVNLFDPNHNSEINYNFGLAHGIPSIASVLLKVHSKKLFLNETSTLLHGILDWILHHRNSGSGSASLYPSVITENDSPENNVSRLAWCYGDLSIAVMFWNAGKELANPVWTEEGLRIMQHSLDRVDPLTNTNLDAGFCHGTAGIAHLFKKFYWATGDKRFMERSTFWISETLKQAKFENGLAGYKTYSAVSKTGEWSNEYGLLTGVTGIGLGLLGYISDSSVDWDECMLLS
jgi:lantibiotic biosynthesis protein